MKTAKISKGNSKINCPNVSLVPGKDCTNCAECIRECYAMKAWRMYANVRKAWKHNSDLMRKSPLEYYGSIVDYCQATKPAYFRFNVAGDIISREHLEYVDSTARCCPNTKFLIYTKNNDALANFTPAPNLTVFRSSWKTEEFITDEHCNALTVEKDQSYPADAFVCPGECGPCGNRCWHTKPGDIVVFEKH